MPDLDQLLREDGVVWRARVDPGRPDTGVMQLVAPRRQTATKRWRGPLGAAAAVVLLAAAIAWLSARGSDPAPNDSALPVISTKGAPADQLKPVSRRDIALALQHLGPIDVVDSRPAGLVTSRGWGFLKLLHGGRSVLVRYLIGDSCDQPVGFRIEQGSNAVVLTSLIRRNPNGGCEQCLSPDPPSSLME